MTTTIIVSGANGLRIAFPVNSTTPMPVSVIVSTQLVTIMGNPVFNLLDYPATIPANSYIVYLGEISKENMAQLPLDIFLVRVTVYDSTKSTKYVDGYTINDPNLFTQLPRMSIGALTLTAT